MASQQIRLPHLWDMWTTPHEQYVFLHFFFKHLSAVGFQCSVTGWNTFPVTRASINTEVEYKMGETSILGRTFPFNVVRLLQIGAIICLIEANPSRWQLSVNYSARKGVSPGTNCFHSADRGLYVTCSE